MQRFLGKELPLPSHNFMDWGKRMQPEVLKAAADELAIEIEQNTVDMYIRQKVDGGLLGYTGDAWTRAPDMGRGAIECKCVFNPQVWMRDWQGGKAVPLHIEIQHQCQMLVGDGEEPFAWGFIVAWFQAELFYFQRKPKPELWGHMDKEARRFFHDLEQGNEGDPWGHRAEVEILNKLFAPEPGKVVDRREETPDNLALAQCAFSLHQFGDDRKFAEKNEKQLKERIRAAVIDAEKLLLPRGVVVDAKRIHKKAHSVKESNYTQLDVYVPNHQTEPDGSPDEPIPIGRG